MPTSVIIGTIASAGAGFALGAGGAAAFTSAALLAGAKVGLVTGVLSGALQMLTKREPTGSGDRSTRRYIQGPTPSKWIPGRARVAGQIVFWGDDPEDAATFHMVIVLSNDAIEGIEGLWLNGETVPLAKSLYQHGETIDCLLYTSPSPRD